MTQLLEPTSIAKSTSYPAGSDLLLGTRGMLIATVAHKANFERWAATAGLQTATKCLPVA